MKKIGQAWSHKNQNKWFPEWLQNDYLFGFDNTVLKTTSLRKYVSLLMNF